jgi:hypothetical protein
VGHAIVVPQGNEGRRLSAVQADLLELAVREAVQAAAQSEQLYAHIVRVWFHQRLVLAPITLAA